MRDIISNLKFMEVDDHEDQVAAFKEPQSVFGAGKCGGFIGDPDENLLDVEGFDDGSSQRTRDSHPASTTQSPAPTTPNARPPTSGRKRTVVVMETEDDAGGPARKKAVRFG
jgi:hypothetical protein